MEAAARCTCPGGPLYVVCDTGWADADTPGAKLQRDSPEPQRVDYEPDHDFYRRGRDVGFAEWADRWLESLERKPATVASYRSTIAHAKGVSAIETCAGSARRMSNGSTESCASEGARLPLAQSTYACLALACRRQSSTGMRGRTLFESCHRRRGPALNERKRLTSRTRSFLVCFGVSRTSRSGHSVWSRSRRVCGRASSSGCAGATSISIRPLYASAAVIRVAGWHSEEPGAS